MRFLPLGLLGCAAAAPMRPLSSRIPMVSVSRRALTAAAASAASAFPLLRCDAQISALGYELNRMSQPEIEAAAANLTPLQRAVSLKAYTERSFTGKTTNGYSHDNKAKVCSAQPRLALDLPHSGQSICPSAHAVCAHRVLYALCAGRLRWCHLRPSSLCIRRQIRLRHRLAELLYSDQL